MIPAIATSAERAEPILHLRGIGRRFGGVVAVADVDLTVDPGERRAILGPNGAGKTTLFNLISGEFPPTAGTVQLFGRDATATPARTRAHMGLSRTFQTSRLFGGLIVEDNLYLAVLGVRDGHLRLVKTNADEEIRERARAMADATGLGDRLDVMVADLSHGEQRQLEVGMARAAEPKLMMLDEPAAGLSRAERVNLTEMLLALDPSITLILIEHDVTNPRVLIMDEPSEGLAPTIIEDLVQTIKDRAAAGMWLLVVEQNLGVATSLAERQLVMMTGQIATETTADELANDTAAQRRYLGVEPLPDAA